MRYFSIPLLLFVFTACSRNKTPPLNPSNLVTIFSSYDLASSEEKQQIITKYHLDDEKQRQEYYNKIEEIMSNKNDFDQFLNQVDAFKKNKIASQPSL